MATKPARTAASLIAPREARPAFRRVETYGDPGAENLLVHGDNLDALAWLGQRMPGGFACAYLDPPFNTGRAFRQYIDARPPEEWLEMMRPRLAAVRALLREDGAVFVEIDDTMLGALQLLMDDVFGRDRRLFVVTIVRSASTGHKAINRGPVNVTDFLLGYEKLRGRFRYRRQKRVRKGYDPAYSTWLVNPKDPPSRFRFEPLARHVAMTLGFASSGAAAKKLGRSELQRRLEAYALAHADRVVRFAQPRYEAVSEAARRTIDASKKDPDRILRLVRPGHSDMLLRGGNRLLFLSRKVEEVEGEPRIVESLTNVWDDIGFQGISKEGGVVFSRNKKPERLLARILAMATDPGDWVLDPFLGSGTTAAVAHKMGRRWVGVEEGSQLRELCLPRLRCVVDGRDATGVSRSVGWRGGGGFGVYA